MVELIACGLATYMLVVLIGSFLLVAYHAYRHGIEATKKIQEHVWYRTVGLINGLIVFVLCVLVILDAIIDG